MIQCKACGHYRPSSYSHGWCNRLRQVVCGIIKACLDARIEKAE